MRSLYKIILITIVLIAFINAQGITNTIGGSSSSDQFQIKNNNGTTLFTVTGEGNVGIGTTSPFSKLSVGSAGPSNTTIYSITTLSDGLAVKGVASDGGSGFHYGGFFQANGKYGQGVYGEAVGSDGVGVRGAATGTSGSGIMGVASDQSGVNYGVYGVTHSPNGWAGYFNGRGYFSGDVGIGTNTPEATLDVNGTTKLGANGIIISEIIELTGTTTVGDELTNVVWPNGYNMNNSRILSVEILDINSVYRSLGPWVCGLLQSSTIRIYTNNSYLEGRPYRLILMKVG